MTRVQRVFEDAMSQLYSPPVLLACWDGKAFSRGAPTSNLQGNRNHFRRSAEVVLGKGRQHNQEAFSPRCQRFDVQTFEGGSKATSAHCSFKKKGAAL